MPIDWRPCGLLSGRAVRAYAVLVLNQPINGNALDAVIQHATFLVCADGGADRLRKYGESVKNGTGPRLPDVIVGDLDSLSDDTADYYRASGVEIVRQPDQGSTDFTKALSWIREAARQSLDDRPLDVIVLGGLGGRVDQAFSQIHHLYMARRDERLLRGSMYLLSEQSLSYVLDPGPNVIHIEPGYFEQNVGIIPVCGQATITLKGFEWDVQNWPTEFGAQMSTSNHIRSDRLEVSFQGAPPLFTLELAARFQASHAR
ncbi:hypothetical protein DV737_g4899, partial [Chaetothyriales sp. CBS 132003]